MQLKTGFVQIATVMNSVSIRIYSFSILRKCFLRVIKYSVYSSVMAFIRQCQSHHTNFSNINKL